MNIRVTCRTLRPAPNLETIGMNRGLSDYILSRCRDVSQMQKKFNATPSQRCQQYHLTFELRGVKRYRTSCQLQGAAIWSVHRATA